jgi:hypothetical protein
VFLTPYVALRQVLTSGDDQGRRSWRKEAADKQRAVAILLPAARRDGYV